MGWVVFGFVTAIFLEMLIRIFQNHERIEPRAQRRVQVSFPWYAYALGGLAAYAALRKPKKGGKNAEIQDT